MTKSNIGKTPDKADVGSKWRGKKKGRKKKEKRKTELFDAMSHSFPPQNGYKLISDIQVPKLWRTYHTGR